jgi:hypothetical protein
VGGAGRHRESGGGRGERERGGAGAYGLGQRSLPEEENPGRTRTPVPTRSGRS